MKDELPVLDLPWDFPRPGSPLYPLSPVIDVLPRISEDHASVELNMNPAITEFTTIIVATPSITLTMHTNARKRVRRYRQQRRSLYILVPCVQF